MDEDQPRCGLRCARVTDKGICDRCTRLTAEDLEAMASLEATVREKLYAAQGSTMGDRVSGSRERPLGFSVDALSLIGAVNDPQLPMRAELRDQIGPTPMLDALGGWARVIADERGFTYHTFTYPKVSVALVAAFLLNQHPWTVQQPWADEYAFEVRGCAHEARRLCGLYDAPVDIKVGVPCKRDVCRSLGLYAIPGEDRIVCPTCGNRLKRSEYDDHVKTWYEFKKGQTA